MVSFFYNFMENSMSNFMGLNILREALQPPSADVLAMRELEDARRELLAAYSAQEYSSAMCVYNQDRVARLQRHLSSLGAAT